jgi:hypothetical protein
MSNVAQLYDRFVSGDPDATVTVKRLKLLSAAGDERAARAFAALSVHHWRRRSPQGYAVLLDTYTRAKQGSPDAVARLRDIVRRTRNGDPSARVQHGALRAISRLHKLPPGAPRIGGYGMPLQNRPGVIFGAGELPDLGQLGGLGGLAQNLANQYGVPVIPPAPTPSTPYLPLTPQAIVELIALITRAIQSRPTPMFMAKNPMTDGLSYDVASQDAAIQAQAAAMRRASELEAQRIAAQRAAQQAQYQAQIVQQQTLGALGINASPVAAPATKVLVKATDNKPRATDSDRLKAAWLKTLPNLPPDAKSYVYLVEGNFTAPVIAAYRVRANAQLAAAGMPTIP